MKIKPTFILFQDDYQRSKKGIMALQNVFVDQKGLSMDQLRKLTLKYPAILSKNETQLEEYFKIM